MIILDPSQHALTVVNAGHMPPLVRRSDGRLEEIGQDVSGLPLLVDRDVQYGQCCERIDPGDSLLLFTDGVTEMMNPGGEQFGMQRIRQCVDVANPAQVGERIVTELQRFGAGRPAQDDVCLVCCGRTVE
jgi:serine phosphatase RsbU (regulator of sigma subunit)